MRILLGRGRRGAGNRAGAAAYSPIAVTQHGTIPGGVNGQGAAPLGHSGGGGTRAAGGAPVMWIGGRVSFFEHRCADANGGNGGARKPTEFYVSAPCIVLTSGGAFRTRSALGEAVGDASTAVFRNAMSPYIVESVAGGTGEGTTIRIAPEAAREMVESLSTGEGLRGDRNGAVFGAAASPCPARARLLHAAIRREIERGQGADGVAVEEAGLEVAAGVIGAWRQATGAAARGGNGTVARGSRELVRAAQEFIAARATTGPSLSEIAAAAGCSPWHLSRLFRRVTGRTIHEHLMTARLGAALRLVMGTREDLTPIALACGFCDHSHLTLAFRREFGVTPSGVRRKGLRDLRP